MNKREWYVACALFLTAVLWATPSATAQSPFDGTWHLNIAQAKISPKPIIFYLSQGWYHCVSCVPAFDIQADGQDHPVTGQSYDSLSVTVTDPNTLSIAARRAGKPDFEQTRTVSADGKTLTVKTTSHPMNGDQPVSAEVTAKRTGVPPSGVHAVSGEWVVDKISESENGLITTYKTNGDAFTMSTPTGETYTAKFDGSDYPVKGATTYDTVSLKKIDAHTIEETDKRAGTVVEVAKISVSGRTMTIVATNKLTDRTSTYTSTRK